MLDEIWDWITELPGNIAEFFSDTFDGMGEISMFGLGFGAFFVIFIYLLRDYMLKPFLLHMGAVEYYFWGGATYLACFAAGYFVGKHFENSA